MSGVSYFIEGLKKRVVRPVEIEELHRGEAEHGEVEVIVPIGLESLYEVVSRLTST